MTLMPQTFATFQLTASNRFPHAAALSVAEAPPGMSYNPLVIHGDAGSGKTHLVQAMARYARELKPSLRIATAKATEMSRIPFPLVNIAILEDIHEMDSHGSLLPLARGMLFRSRQLVITTRCTDAVAALAPQMDEFEWGLITGFEPGEVPASRPRLRVV